MLLLFVGFISEFCDPLDVTDAALEIDSLAVRRICNVVDVGMAFDRRFKMFDVELDLLTDPLIFSRMTDGTDLALSDCLSESFLAKISLDRALRKLRRACACGFCAVVAAGKWGRTFGWLSRGELTELVDERRPLVVTDDGDELVELLVVANFLLTALRAGIECCSVGAMIKTFSLLMPAFERCAGTGLPPFSLALRTSN